MPSSQLFPEVLDATTIGARFTTGVFLPIGVEGQMDNDGSAAVKEIKIVDSSSEAVALFGANSKLSNMIRYLLDRGAGPIYAAASKKGSAPLLADRQAAWQDMESMRPIRIRLTDSESNADHIALAQSCGYANLMSNKQFGFGGMPASTTKSALLSAAAAISASGIDYASRMHLIAPSIYDQFGNQVSGGYAAASVAARVAQNNDPSDDLDTVPLPLTTAIERDTVGMPVFRQKVVSGVLSNDFEDLLQGGVSPLCNHRDGGVAITHLRTCYITDGTYDSLMTRLIADQVFIVIRMYCEDFKYLRKGNTPTNRELLAVGIEDILESLASWVQPVELGNGKMGYGVTVTASPDKRQMIVDYQGEVVRGTQTILVNGHLTIPV